MLLRISCIILINILSTKSQNLGELEETAALNSITAQLAKLNPEQIRSQDGYLKETENSLLRIDFQFLKADILFLRAELAKLKSNDQISQTLQAELLSEIQRLKVDFQLEIKGLKGKFQSEIEDLTAKLVQQEKLIVGFRKKLDGAKEFRSLKGCTEMTSSGTTDMLIREYSDEPFEVLCDAETEEGGWTVILRRQYGTVDFNRNWTEYQNGFGYLNDDFFLGLDKIHAITTERKQELLVILEDDEEDKRFEKYDEFAIGDVNQNYILSTLGEASGTAGDSLRSHYQMEFATIDRDNKYNCAEKYHGGWWYERCHESHLTGTYGDNGNSRGVTWKTFRGNQYSLKRALMMIRPKK